MDKPSLDEVLRALEDEIARAKHQMSIARPYNKKLWIDAQPNTKKCWEKYIQELNEKAAELILLGALDE